MICYKILINGELIDTGDHLSVINPATEKGFATVARASLSHLDAAVAAARQAFQSWRSVLLEERWARLAEMADLILENREILARTLTQEQGKCLTESFGEVDLAEQFCRYCASVEIPVEIIQNDSIQKVEIHRKPLGVVAAIIPWNYPLLVAVWKLAPALLMGNTVVLKPAPTTPVATLLLGEIISEVFPAGVVNIIADDNELGAALSSHPDVAKVSFTGSTATGKKVMAGAASTLKRLTLELGGNDAAIVLDDAIPEQIAASIFEASFENSGQVCNSIKRLYVHESIYDEMCARLAALAEAAIIGNGLDAGTQFGPLQNKLQFDKVVTYIEDGRKHGKIIAGGYIPDRPGYFIPPTVVRDISEGTRLVDEEPFGPVLPVIKYSDVDDAVSRANASSFALSGSVWSSNTERAWAVALNLDSGTVWVNTHGAVAAHIPFPTNKESGIGVERGVAGLQELSAMQVVFTHKKTAQVP